MTLFPPIPEPVPFKEVAAVLAEAASRVGCGPPAHITASARQLASALEHAGFWIVRAPVACRQLTL